MAKYAAQTSVPVSRSREELRTLIIRFGASEFAIGERGTHYMIGFMSNGLHLRFTMDCPTDEPQEERRMWRALNQVIKAKLVAVMDGISTFEQEFLSWVVMPNGQTLGDALVPQLEHMDNVPPVLPNGGPKLLTAS